MHPVTSNCIKKTPMNTMSSYLGCYLLLLGGYSISKKKLIINITTLGFLDGNYL